MSTQTNANAAPDISVIILCYRAGELVRTVVSRMKASLEARGLSYELVLVGNYDESRKDTDTTPAVVRDIALHDAHVIAITEKKEGMFGWDVRSGLRAAQGKTVAFIDGDAQNPVEDVVRVYDARLEKGTDMAQTYRVKRHDGAQRIFISRMYNAMVAVLFPGVIVYDINSKPKIFTRDALQKLRLTSDDWFIDAEIVIQAGKLGFTVAQIPTVFLKNEHRSSFVNVGTIFEFLRNLLRYRFFGPRV